ncbi:MAG: pectinesterase family protein, partial [Clostridia bacterium]|nr:pectinesterase family protein [Clostridia bacterium]
KISCSVCGETLYDGEAEVYPLDEGYVAPACESEGTRYYEGTVSFALTDETQCKYTNKIYVTLDPTGHTYPDSVTQSDLYHWTFPEGDISEGTEVTIAAECVVCHQTIETFTTTITNINTVPATEGNNGSKTYTAVVEIEGENVTLTFVEILTAAGHTYPDDDDTTYVVWDWENMDTQTHTISYAIYCADGDSFLLTEGTATYSTETKKPTCEVAGSTVYTATVTVTADGTTHTYSGTYSEEIPATGHAWTAQFDWDGVGDIAETETGTVQVTLTCSECRTSKTLEASYTRTEYVASTCSDAGHMIFTATLNMEGVDEPFTSSTTVTLPLSEEHTYPGDGSTNVVWDWENRNEVDNTIKLTVYCTVCGNAVIENVEVNYVVDQSGTYWIATYSDGEHVYTGSYLIPQGGETDVVVEVDFNDGSFSNTQTAFVTESEKDSDGNQTAPGSSAVVNANGGSTGFTAMGTASDSKTIQIGTSDGCTYLAFNGSASTTKNTVSYYLEAGIYKVQISYFSGSSGRWATVLDSSGKDRDELIAEEDKTSGSGEIKTRTIYLPLDAAQYIYIGSKNSGLYVTFIGIYKVEAEETKTVIGVSLDESSTQLEMGSSMVISAMAELSDGKHYLGYTGAEYSWDISGEGSVTYTGSGDNISVTGQSLGQVVVTVTINGTYSAYCEIEIIEKVVYDITSLTIDFSDSDTYSWINTSNTGNDYSYWIVTLIHGWNSIGSGRLNTGGGSSTGNGRYFILDLSEYMGQTLTITVDFESAGASSEDRSVCLDTQCSSAGSTTSSTTLAYATSNISGDRQKLEYSGIIENDVLYLTYSGNINIYSIEISIDSGDPTVMGVTLSSESVVVNVGDTFTITADVKMNFGTFEGNYVWEVVGGNGIVETDYSAGATTNVLTVTAVGEGGVTITLTVGDFTASCKVTVYPEGESIYETVTTIFDYATPLAYYGSGNGPTGDAEYVQGIFTISGGAKFYDGYINTQGNDIIILLSGIDNTISFTGTGASSSANPLTVYLYKDGEDITPNDWSSVNLANSAVSEFYVSGLGTGTYTIKTSASVRVENLTVTQSLPISDPDSIVVTAGNVDFLKGRNIDVNDLGLNVILHYENGREDPLTVGEVSVAIDSDLSEGAHEVTVTYHYDDAKGNQADFSATIYIYIYSVESITISDFSMEYTGGTYYTNNVQKIFLVGDSINYDYAAVTATASCTYYDTESGANKTITKEFVLTSDEVYFSTDANMYAVGTYTVTATVNMGVSEGVAKTASYQIDVVTKEGADITTVCVDATAGIGMDENGIYTVNTINDAIMLIKLLGASDAERKFIYVGEGQYWEKIYIDIPNLSLIGSNSSDSEKLATRQDSESGGTEIVYDAMNGVMDPSGTTTYSTVGSATVTVASQATGFYAANITFRNYWNSNDLYNEALEITSSTQADAAYINADQSYFYNVTFTGYHDTLEAENGRQVYDHCYIEGRTDYIFGSTATCYFKDSTIHSIGAGLDQSNGGYVVAYKGNGNAGTVEYGYIFDGCNFEGDGNVKEHSVALGRAWGEDMMMVIMNSTFDSSFAMGGYTGASSALRYCRMNYDPDFTKIFEYNNSGASAIDVSLGSSGYTVDGNNLVSDSNGNPVFTIPANPTIYSDMSVIFAATNGTVSYGTDWNGKCDVITITVMNNSEVLTTVYGTGAMSVSDLKTAINVRLDDAEVDKIYVDGGFSTELIGSITSDTTVYVSMGEKDMTVPASVTYDFYGRETDSDEDISGWYDYLYVDLGANGSFRSNKSGWYMLTGDATITVKLSAGSIISVQMYESDKMFINGSAVTGVDEGDGTYWYTYELEDTREFVISANGTLYIRSIQIIVPVIYEVGDTIYLNDLDSSDGSYNVSAGGTGSYKGMNIEGYFRNNGNSFEVDVGTVIKIQSVPGATAKLSFYQDAYWVEAEIVTDDDGLITITITSKGENGGYISSIRIVDGGESSVIYQIGDEISFVGMDDGDVYSNVDGYEYKGIVITGTFRNNSNSVQVGVGTTIQIQSTSDATAEVVFFSGYTGDYEISTDENGLITIVFTSDTGSSGIYLTRIFIVTNPDYGDSESGSDGSDAPSVDEHTYPESNDTVHVVWDWENRTETTETTGYVTVTIICVDCGDTIVSEQTSYIVDENNKSYWYVEVAEGDITYSSMYRIPGEGTAYVEESFIVPSAGSEDGVSSESFAAGTSIVDNSLFTLTAYEAMQYSAGAAYGNISGGSAIVTFADMSGTAHSPDQGIQTADTISANGGTKENILTFTANDEIHAYIYVSLGDNGFTGNRSGEIFYSMDGVVVETKTVSARNEIFYIELDMQKGQSISIGATNNHASSTGKLWLWGAEAYTLDGEKIEYGVEYTVTFNTNQTSIENFTTAVYNYSAVSAPILPNITGYYFAGWYMNEKCTAAYDFSEPVTCDIQLYAKWVELDAEITYIEGAYESIAFEFTDSNASGAKIYYKLVSDSSYTLMNDPDAVRQLGAETVRVDIIGLRGDAYYNVK